MELNFLSQREKATLQLRGAYEAAGYTKYRMARFEEYSLYQQNSAFLSGEQVITFTDLDGRLLALKPDVTLSIAKSARLHPGQTLHYYYNEKVYRPSAQSHTFREIDQMGLECIGAVDGTELARVVELARQSLALISPGYMLVLGHMGFLAGLLQAAEIPASARPRVMACLRDKNAHELRAAALAAGAGNAGADLLQRALALTGPNAQVLEGARQLAANPAMTQAVEELSQLLAAFDPEEANHLRLDLSLAGEMEYYNGLLFNGYVSGIPGALLRGGRYDLLMKQFDPRAGAVGFALYLDEMDRLSAPLPPVQQQTEDRVMLNVALPKGRLGDKVYGLLARHGYGCDEDYNATRKLVVENREAGIRYFLVKPSDVAIYVQHGAADVGIVGKDILAEAGSDVYELLDTHLGRCRMCVAAPAGYRDDPSRPVRVATKFVNIARDYYTSMGREIDIIKLNGSIELAPILGLSDVIVDIVETGTTLRENGLQVVTEFMPISARFIANKASYQFKKREVTRMVQRLEEDTKND